MITVQHKFIRTTPRKIRLVLDAIRGLTVNDAEARLRLATQQSSRDVYGAVHASIAAAKDKGMTPDNWIIIRALCDEGPRLKRRIFGSRGRTRPIQKQMSHIRLTVGPQNSIVAKETKSAQNAKEQ